MQLIARKALCCLSFLVAGIAQAEDSQRMELGMFRLDRFDQDEQSRFQSSESILHFYGRSKGWGIFDTPLDGQLTLEAETGAAIGMENGTDSSVWANLNFYLPFWFNSEDKPKGSNGTYNPDNLPPFTFATSLGVQKNLREGAQVDSSEWHITPYFEFHHWILEDKLDADGPYADITVDLGVSFVDSDLRQEDRQDRFASLDLTYSPHPRWELSARSSYLSSDFDQTGLDTENVWTNAIRARFSIFGEQNKERKLGLYLDIVAGHVDIDGGAFDESYNFLLPGLYLQYPANAYTGGPKWTGSRSYRRGGWYY